VPKGAGAAPQGEGTPHVRKLSNPRVPKIMLEGGLCSTSERPIAVLALTSRGAVWPNLWVKRANQAAPPPPRGGHACQVVAANMKRCRLCCSSSSGAHASPALVEEEEEEEEDDPAPNPILNPLQPAGGAEADAEARGGTAASPALTEDCLAEAQPASERFADFTRVGGRFVEMPSQEELLGALDAGSKRWSLGIRPTDFLVPVCHQGMNRSQIMRLALSELQDSFAPGGMGFMRGLWVSRPHGASSGCDAHTAYEGLDDTNFFGYLFDTGEIFSADYRAADDNDPQQGPLQRAFEATFKTAKSPRLGEELAAEQWMLNPPADAQPDGSEGDLLRLERSRTQSHRWFNRFVFGSIAAVQVTQPSCTAAS
jgi:hypothetical protein